MSDKECSKCGNVYPETTDYFHKSKGGFLRYCKLCRNKQEREHYNKTQEQILSTKKKYREREKEILNKKSKIYRDKFREKYGISNSGLHSYIKKRKPISESCDLCGKKGKLELSNISGEYQKDIEDWQWIHKKCHMFYDLGLKILLEVRN